MVEKGSIFGHPKCGIIRLITHLDEAKKQPVVAYHRSPAHVIQVQLYMYLLLRSDLARWKDTRFEGAVVYPGEHQVDVPADSIDDAFAARLAAFMQKMTSDMPPRRVPSGDECRWCKMAFGNCPDRFVDVT